MKRTKGRKKGKTKQTGVHNQRECQRNGEELKEEKCSMKGREKRQTLEKNSTSRRKVGPRQKH
jgi:hypothetical protein